MGIPCRRPAAGPVWLHLDSVPMSMTGAQSARRTACIRVSTAQLLYSLLAACFPVPCAGPKPHAHHTCCVAHEQLASPCPRAAPLQVGWGATSDFRENWVWDQAADTYVKDSDMADTLRKNNPQVRAVIYSRVECAALLA